MKQSLPIIIVHWTIAHCFAYVRIRFMKNMNLAAKPIFLPRNSRTVKPCFILLLSNSRIYRKTHGRTPSVDPQHWVSIAGAGSLYGRRLTVWKTSLEAASPFTRTSGPYGLPGSWGNGDLVGLPLLLSSSPSWPLHKAVVDWAGIQ
jgi:hypothetical protein